MPALRPTNFYGTIAFLGRVCDRETTLRSEPLKDVHLTYAGALGEAHAGLTRPSCSRVTAQHPRGTDIRNVRQLSVLSFEELREIAKKLSVREMDPSWLGSSIVISGIPDWSHVPPGSRLQAASGTTLVIDMQNRPCHLPAPVIDEDAPGRGAGFKAAAKGLRGVTAWVEREGKIALNDKLRLHIPDQRRWDFTAEAFG